MNYESRLYPLPHRLLVSWVYVVESPELFVDVRSQPLHYHPKEIPAYKRKRLVDFLEGRYPVPPEYLETIIPQDEVANARKIYRQLRATGAGPGEAIVDMGLVTRKNIATAPELGLATIIRRGCDCIGAEHVFTRIGAGDPVDGDLRVITCSEAISAAAFKTQAEQAQEEARAANARAAEFDAIRSMAVG